MTSAGRCVLVGPGPVCASSEPPAVSRAAVINTRVERPGLRISLLDFPPSQTAAAGPGPYFLGGQVFELLARIDQILASLEFLPQPVVIRGRFRFLIGS